MSISKTLYYKSAELHNCPGQNLQALISQALKLNSKAVSRQQSVDADSSTFRWINFHTVYKGILVGEMLNFTKGSSQPYTRVDKELEALPLEAMKLDDGSEFVDQHMLFFGIKKNHVVSAQSFGLRIQQLEDYLNWFLRKNKLLNDEQFVALVDRPPEELEQKISNTDTIEFSGPVTFAQQIDGEEQSSVEHTKVKKPKDSTKKITITPKGAPWEAIRSFFPPEFEMPEELDLDDIVNNRELVVKLEVSWKRAPKNENTKLLDVISNQLRHVENEVDYKIWTRGGDKITKDQIKLSLPVTIGVLDSGLPKRDDVWVRMYEWLTLLATNGRI